MNIKVCDICGREFYDHRIEVREIKLYYRYATDSAGEKSQEYKSFDLCVNHERDILKQVLGYFWKSEEFFDFIKRTDRNAIAIKFHINQKIINDIESCIKGRK